MHDVNNISRKLPLGIQDFEGLIKDGYAYIDKTAYIYSLINMGKQYFLSRPRRFGKSLLLSTMAAYWHGRKELFRGLAIEKVEDGNGGERGNFWQEYPVFYFDFNGKNYQEKGKLEEKLDQILRGLEDTYGNVYSNRSLEERFEKLLLMAHEQTGRRCVVLVDEYDKPLLEVMGDAQLEKHNTAVFKGFFSVLKSSDKDIKFVFITGVTKFSKVSIFSDLNHLTDISLDNDYAGICGITETELEEYNFKPEIENLMSEHGISREECLGKLKKAYDGYHFSAKGEGVYNPYSLFSAFRNKKFGAYWFETGTPTFLVKKIKDISFDARQFSDLSLEITEQELSDYRTDNPDIVPLLYQTGYLTISGDMSNEYYYTLRFPNEEVKYGFLNSLLPQYSPICFSGSGKSILEIKRYVEKGDIQNLYNAFVGLYAGISYTAANPPYEHYFQTVIYLVFELLNQYVRSEVHSALGRADCIVETNNFVYIIEFKRDDSADNALKQIELMGYGRPFAADKRKLYKIGVNFDTKTRNISEWKVGEDRT